MVEHIMKKNIYTFDEYIEDIRAVVWGINAEGWSPDFVVGIMRGGMVPATHLSHILHVPLIALPLSFRDNKTESYGESMYKCADLIGRGCRLLFVDDILDSGKTFYELHRSLEDAGVVKETLDEQRTAALIYNTTNGIFKVDYAGSTIDREVDPRWVEFWWEKLPASYS
jgi:hypoxanthine phosphoribosyltransferase